MDVLYNIINNEGEQMIFNYAIIFVIFIFIFNNLNFNMTILLGLLFATIVVYYWYHYRTENNLINTQIYDDKFNIVNPYKKSLKKYNNIVDSLFYIEDFKKFNIPNYNKITNLFENFTSLYDNCLIDNSFIGNYYNTLNNIKYNIIDCIGKFNYTTNSSTYSDKLNDAQNKIEKLLNDYIDKIISIQNNDIKENGYNNNTKLLDISNILPSNYFETNNNVLY